MLHTEFTLGLGHPQMWAEPGFLQQQAQDMDESDAYTRSFAFPLPLSWPESVEDRIAFEREIIDYINYFNSLFTRSKSSEREVLQSMLEPFARDLGKLWAKNDMPQSVKDFLSAFV